MTQTEETETAPARLGDLEFFSDAVGTVYADTAAEAHIACVAMLEDKGYGPVQARATTQTTLRFLGVATHVEAEPDA